MTRRFLRIHTSLGPHERLQADVSRALAAEGREAVHLDAPELSDRLAEIEVLVCARAPRIDWSKAIELRLVQFLSSGVDGFWPAEGLAAGVQIANARGIHLPEMRDHVLAMMLAFERHVPRILAQQRDRIWRPFAAGSLSGKTLCLLGLGAVGGSVATAGAALGMRVTGIRRKPRPTAGVSEVGALGDLSRMLAPADYVVVALPRTDATCDALDANAVAVLRPAAVLVDVSRGGIVDVQAVVARLRTDTLRGAAIDVFEGEPLAADSALWDVPNLIVSPHLAGDVPGYVDRALRVVVENISRVERGEPPRSPVDRRHQY